MKRIPMPRYLWPILVLAALAAAHCSSDRIDSRELADALAEEFTDGIEFEDQIVQSGAPNQTVALTPQISFLTAPHVISPPDPTLIERADYGEWFTVSIQADSDLTGQVVGGVAFVMQANKDDAAVSYKVIQPAVPNITGTTISFRARVNSFAGAPGNAFTVNLALLLADGRISGWFPWNIVLYPMGGESTKVPLCICEQQTHEELNQAGQPVQMLDSTNLRLLDRDACAATQEGQFILYQFFGNLEGEPFNSAPCSLWHSMVGLQSLDEVSYPDGTRFWPSWIRIEAERAACKVEIRCP